MTTLREDIKIPAGVITAVMLAGAVIGTFVATQSWLEGRFVLAATYGEATKNQADTAKTYVAGVKAVREELGEMRTEQREQLKELREEHREAMRELRREIRSVRRRLPSSPVPMSLEEPRAQD